MIAGSWGEDPKIKAVPSMLSRSDFPYQQPESHAELASSGCVSPSERDL